MTEVASQGKRDFRKAVPINDVCIVCQKTVYPVEKCTADDKVMHKACLRCGHCNKLLSLGNYAALNGTFYCKPHFKQLFALKGNYTDGFSNSNNAAKEEPNYERSVPATQSSAPAAAIAKPVAPKAETTEAHISTGKSLAERLHAYEAVVRSNSQEIERSNSRRQKEALVRKDEKDVILSSSQESLPVPSDKGISSYLNAYKEAASNNNLTGSNSNLEAVSVRRVSRELQHHEPQQDDQARQLKTLQTKFDNETKDRKRLESDVSDLKRTVAARDLELSQLKQKVEDLEYQNQQLQEALESAQSGERQQTGRYVQDEEDDSNWDENQ